MKPCPRDIYIFVLPRKLQVKNLWRYHEYYNIRYIFDMFWMTTIQAKTIGQLVEKIIAKF